MAAEALIHGLRDSGYEVHSLLEQQRTGRLATVRLVKAGLAEVLIDLLFASSGIENEVAERAELIEVFPRLFIPVADLPSLLALKVLASDEQSRPQDVLDIKSLLAEATDADMLYTNQLLQLITARGFNRGKNLAADLGGYLKRFPRA